MFVEPNSTQDCGLSFEADDKLTFSSWNGAGGRPLGILMTTQFFRDPSAWYHIVIVVDTTNATASNRLRMYINGVQVSSFSTATYPSQNAAWYWNEAYEHRIGRYASAGGGAAYFDGYLTEINFIGGQALSPSSFGETDAVTGVWKPKKYAGTYGTNGFYLNFSDNSAATAAAIGADSSGNGNNWTPNNISVTAGATYDSMIDVPTPYADGGNGRGNYCTLNPVGSDMGFGSLSNGNLTATTNFRQKRGTIGVNTGKWYWEVLCVSDANPGPAYAAGVVDVSTNVATNPFSSGSGAVFYYANNGNKYINGTQTSYGSTYTTNDVIGVALNMDSGTVTFYKNNTSQGSVTLHSATAIYVPLVHSGSSDPNNTVYAANFGQRPFAYTPPTGFKALNTQNLPEPTIVDGGEYFNAVLYTGTGSTQSITGVGFQPDLVWFKDRTQAASHALFDAVRGRASGLASNLTDAQYTSSDGNDLVSFDSNGFTVGTVQNWGSTNNNTKAIVSWNWKANGAGVSNTDGSITSTVSANTTAGFSVVTYTGTGANATVGHGLGVAPKMVVVKSRNPSSVGVATSSWLVYHTSVGAGGALILNTTNATVPASTWWNSTAPASSVFTVGTDGNVNQNAINYVAYCFSEVAGYSKFGSYTGNGSADGPFVFCGFRPRLIMIKRSDSTSDWIIKDTARSPFNTMNERIDANGSGAENSYFQMDVTAGGFKVRHAGADHNVNGGTYIFMAFAEHPFKTSLAR
jgi:hypothetical protein